MALADSVKDTRDTLHVHHTVEHPADQEDACKNSGSIADATRQYGRDDNPQEQPEERGQQSTGKEIDQGDSDDSTSDSCSSSSSDEESEYVEFEPEEEEVKDPENRCHDVPFWFNNEETDHISCIMERYSKVLHLEERREHIRAPPPFIGQIKRIQVDNEMFTTLDQVTVYIRNVKPLGIVLPSTREIWFVTSWDDNEGMPVRSFKLDTTDLLSFWRARTVGDYSYLYCLPTHQTDSPTHHDWRFYTSAEEQPVMWAIPSSSSSAPNKLTRYFNLYLPKPLFGGGEDDDEEEGDSDE